MSCRRGRNGSRRYHRVRPLAPLFPFSPLSSPFAIELVEIVSLDPLLVKPACLDGTGGVEPTLSLTKTTHLSTFANLFSSFKTAFLGVSKSVSPSGWIVAQTRSAFNVPATRERLDSSRVMDIALSLVSEELHVVIRRYSYWGDTHRCAEEDVGSRVLVQHTQNRSEQFPIRGGHRSRRFSGQIKPLTLLYSI